MAKGVKHDGAKADYSLLDLATLESVVRVLEFGARKYSRDNWKKVKPPRRYWSAALRHLADYRAGKTHDEESGQSPIAHAITDLLFVLWHVQRGTFKPEDFSK